jgi:hypothetical protein
MSQTEDNDNFEIWEKLVRTAETLEGGINRNSSPQAITSVRNVYDRFLAKFPLFFGYWKKYADLEFSIAGTEAAEMVCWYRKSPATILTFPGLRARRCQHHQFRRPLDELLLLQGRDQPRLRHHKRVSIGDELSLPQEHT